MAVGTEMIFYFGILMISSVEQIFTSSECNITVGDCVTEDYPRNWHCRGKCSRTDDSCLEYKGIDTYGKQSNFRCHCKYLSDCKFKVSGKCENGCLHGYQMPYCQRRKYHEFISHERNKYSELFLNDNTAAKPQNIYITFRNKYRINTIEIYSITDTKVQINFPRNIECKPKLVNNVTVCTGDQTSNQLILNAAPPIYRIKLYGCPPYLYGKDCIKKCHCSNWKECHQLTGICERGCEKGWYGEKCENKTYVNIAQGKDATQTSVYGRSGTTVYNNGTCKTMTTSLTANKAVDGNYNPGYVHGSCASTESEDNPHWMVTFDKPYLISQLRIYNRISNRNRLSSFKVYLGSSLCYQDYNQYTKDVIDIKCPKEVNASYVKISLLKREMLTLCEVEVLQCRRGFYGDMCQEHCKVCADWKCDQFTGKCAEGCVKGYYWYGYYSRCAECRQGTFGKNCTKLCHCAKNENCDKTNGRCPSGCAAGYQGDDCQQECRQGTFGKNCTKLCHCAKNENCDKTNGRCPNGCAAGYHGNYCQQECYNRQFGLGCKRHCYCTEKCNHINGSCPGSCDSGYSGFNCEEECRQGTFGKNCTKLCHCAKNENCDKTNGRCPNGCAAGYQGDDCQQECGQGTFGNNCRKRCNCARNENCDKTNGRCPNECPAGYQKDDCQQECGQGTFGNNCRKRCNCARNENCDKTNGRCPNGCAAGYQEDDCQQKKPSNNILMIGLILLGLFICLIIGVVATVCYCKKRRSTPEGDGNTLEILQRRHIEDRAHLYEETQMDEGDSIYVNLAIANFNSNLQQFVCQKKQEIEPFHDEFLSLPNTLPLPCTEANKAENTQKNRYKTILPYDHSRVKLLADEISSSDYINANYINNNRYVACQGPTQHMVQDFWRMVWQLKCNTIVMLTNIEENGKMKCIQYWPDEQSIKSFGTIQVTHITASWHSSYVHRRFIISKPTLDKDESWTIDHFLFNKWPDHSIPQHPEYILELRNAIKYRGGATFPLIVHCSAGDGRTGTYICIDILLNEMKKGETFDVLTTISKLREDRMQLVQKRIQLEFIYDVLVENILTVNYNIDIYNIPIEFSRIKQIDHSTGISILEQQFQDVIQHVEESKTKVTLMEGNEELQNLNIETVLLNGPSCENEFLLTKIQKKRRNFRFLGDYMQRRLSEYCRIYEFWQDAEHIFNSPSDDLVKLTTYLKLRGTASSVQQFLDNLISETIVNTERPKYLPRKLNGSAKYGHYHVELISVEDKDVCIHSVLKVTFSKKSRVEIFEINHFLSTIWMDGNNPSCTDIIRLSDILNDHQMEMCNRKIAVHCSENFHKSGFLCIIHILKAAMTCQSVINIVRLVRLIKKTQPKIVADFDSYAFIWEVAEHFQRGMSLYSNVIK